nr:site-specific integrase [Aliiroseovarius sediminis]
MVTTSNRPGPNSGLTAALVSKVRAPGKYHDGKGTGLYLRLDKAGRKQWVQRVVVGGKRVELGLGSFPISTLAMAREDALENKRMVRNGKDPRVERNIDKGNMNFANAVDRYLEIKLKEFRNDKHRKQWRSTLDNYAIPAIGHMSMEAVMVQDVLRILEPIWLTKTETARRLRGRIEKVFDWAIVANHRKSDNPARYKGFLSELLPKPEKIVKTRHHAALTLKDAPGWWDALATRGGNSARALQFLCLTATRSGEVRGMTWNEVDLDEALWVIPSNRMKAGREHRVPLPEGAVKLLRDLPRLEGSDFVFFAPQGGMLSDMSLSAVMRKMQKAEEQAGGPGYLDARSGRPAVPHGLRSTFRDWAAEHGYDHVLAELALAHTVGSEVERAYRRTDMLSRRRAMLEDWAAVLNGQSSASD